MNYSCKHVSAHYKVRRDLSDTCRKDVEWSRIVLDYTCRVDVELNRIVSVELM